ncbi:Arc family DNA-binding protein [Glaciimonas immobilis]|nr:Arc family DNA-binding protein [Glaciimonas immobilis]
MARNDPQMNLRLPVELKEQIEDAAAKNNRTLTAEVVDRLQQSFEIVAGLKEKEIEALAEKIAARLTDKMKK